MGRLDGKVAVITGSTRGIGVGIAEAYAYLRGDGILLILYVLHLDHPAKGEIVPACFCLFKRRDLVIIQPVRLS